MILSDEQMHAARHGLPGPIPTWELVDLPVGRQPLPDWAKGFHVDFMIGYANRPHYHLKTDRDLRDWSDQRYVKEGPRYMTTTDDGRAEVFYHDGPVALCEVQLFKREDGTLHKNIRSGPEWYEPMEGVTMYPPYGYEPGEWVKAERLATTQQSGFGGSTTWVTLTDGTEIALRGPWHGGAPAGYVEASYIDMTQERVNYGWWSKRQWHERGGRGGLFITEDLFIRLLARFAPECRCVRVTEGSRSHLEAVRGDWDEPKDWVMARERAARG